MSEPLAPTPLESVDIPEGLAPEIERSLEKFRLLREANRAGYLATTEEQFVTRVEEDPEGVADQRTYLEHQLAHSHARIQAFLGGQAPGYVLERSTREHLISYFDRMTSDLANIIKNPVNWGRKIAPPYSNMPLTGQSVLADLREHEAEHFGLNQGTLAHFGIPRPPEMLKPSGR